MKPHDIAEDDLSGPEERVFFKVDLRLTLEHGDKKKTYDLAVVEFARYFKNSKIRHDHSKLLVESKVIVDNMVGMACPCDEVVVPCLQICGLHGDFLSLELAADGLYVAKAVQTYYFPSGIHRLHHMKKLLACLVAFKAQVMRNKDKMESYLNDGNNDPYDKTFGRQERKGAQELSNWRRISWWPSNKKSPKAPSQKRVFGNTS
ncbi:hypothetical protein BJV82DRAFT_347489 [Fennellomyces sp. T-0311]|nr:hypothetical protein BJV82DRAFT_347489 [Fennellomyces sp. T-0311]